MSRFVVAGATGRVGSVCANELLARKQRVCVIVRDRAKADEWSRRGAEVAVGSLEDAAFVAAALRGADGFFTLLPEDTQAPDFFAWQKRLVESIAAGVRESGVRNIVLLSAVTAGPPAGIGPGRGLHLLEQALRATGARTVALRSGYFQDNLAGAIGLAKQAGIYPNLMPSADVRVPMTATRDVGRLAAATLVEPPAENEVIDVLGPLYSPRELAGKLGARLGKPIQVVDIPPSGHVDALVQAGFGRSFAQALAETFAGFASGRVRPQGDRVVTVTTPVDELLPSWL